MFSKHLMASLAENGQIIGVFVSPPLVCAMMNFQVVLTVANLAAFIRKEECDMAHSLPVLRMKIVLIEHSVQEMGRCLRSHVQSEMFGENEPEQNLFEQILAGSGVCGW